MLPDFKIEIVQKEHLRFDVERNLETILTSLKGSGSDLLIFPEMFLTGYTLGDEVFRYAMHLDDPVFDRIRSVCSESEKYVILGFPERSGAIKGQVHNSACLIGPEGIIGVYRKQHLVDFGPFEEYSYFTPGNELMMADIKGYKIGLMICYDIFFPELTKAYALSGVDMVVCISASPSITKRFFESVMIARAIESTVFVAYSNLVGFDSRMDFWGGGALIGPRGDMISKGPYFEESSIKGKVDERSLRTARRMRPTLRDTKSDLIEDLLLISRNQP